MSDITNSAINYHAYNLHEGEGLVNQVEKLICILLPRGLMVGGFGGNGELLIIRYGDYNKTLPAWIHDFYEHRFTDEPLLAKPENVIASFIAADKNMVVPGSLYDEDEALHWMNGIFLVEGNEVMSVHSLKEDAAKYMFTYPGTLKSILGRYFSNSKVLPLAAYQFYKQDNFKSRIQCCITPEHVYATLYQNHILQWHQVFSYENGEDIAYHLKLLCWEHKISAETVNIECSVAYKGLNPVVNTMRLYFPHIKKAKDDEDKNEWKETISLLEQLYTCAL